MNRQKLEIYIHMKIVHYLVTGIVLLILTATCSRARNEKGMAITGTIQEQGITSYQYGTHTLTNSETFYAITSDSVNLNDYLNREVTVRAEKVEGYPVDGGPEYLRVIQVVE